MGGTGMSVSAKYAPSLVDSCPAGRTGSRHDNPVVSAHWSGLSAGLSAEMLDKFAPILYTQNCGLGVLTSGGLFNRAAATNPLARGSRFALSPLDPLPEQGAFPPPCTPRPGSLAPWNPRRGPSVPSTPRPAPCRAGPAQRSLAPLDTSAGDFVPGTHDLGADGCPQDPTVSADVCNSATRDGRRCS